MKLNKRHNDHRKFLKKWRSFFIQLGKVEAGKEYSENVKKLELYYRALFKKHDESYKSQIKSLARKESEFGKLCDEQREMRNELSERLNNIKELESSSLEYCNKLAAKWQDEKINNYVMMNTAKAEVTHNRAVAEKIVRDYAN